MPLSHFRGGLKSPTRQSRSGDGAPPLPCTGGFTLNRFTVNGFTVNGFTPPVDALRHLRSRKPFAICTCKKCARNSPAICTYKSKDLNFPGINSYKKHRGGVPPLSPCILASYSHRRGLQCPELLALPLASNLISYSNSVARLFCPRDFARQIPSQQ